MTDKIERLRAIEANAWAAYQKARRRLAVKKTFQTQQRVIDEGERWQNRNTDLHEAIRRA